MLTRDTSYLKKLEAYTAQAPSYPVFLKMCLNHPQMLTEFARLKGYTLPKNGLETMIDEATGRDETMMLEFMDFVFDALNRVKLPD